MKIDTSEIEVKSYFVDLIFDSFPEGIDTLYDLEEKALEWAGTGMEEAGYGLEFIHSSYQVKNSKITNIKVSLEWVKEKENYKTFKDEPFDV